MIVVVGRPGLDAAGRPSRAAGRVALAAAEAGAHVELVGSVGDDELGDAVVVALGRAGIGHAAVMRDPAAATPASDDVAVNLPRLDASDVELGLRYVPECRVLVVAETIADDIRRVAQAAAEYHGARLIALDRDAGETSTGPAPGSGDAKSPAVRPAALEAASAEEVGRRAADIARQSVPPGARPVSRR